MSSPKTASCVLLAALSALTATGMPASAQFFIEDSDVTARVTTVSGSSTHVNVTGGATAKWSGPIPAPSVRVVWTLGARVRPAWGYWNNGSPNHGTSVPPSGVITCDFDTCGGTATNVPKCSIAGGDNSYGVDAEVAISDTNTGYNHEDGGFKIGFLDCDQPPPPPPDSGDEPAPGCDPSSCSPILLLLEPGQPQLTGIEDAVEFDIDGDGELESLSWTAASYSGGGFLVLDRDQDGSIGSGKELFGTVAEQPRSDDPNGFLALGVFDDPARGGNGDGVISDDDAVFGALEVWTDRNHDAVAQAQELQALRETDVRAIELDYVRSQRRDRFGNELHWASRVHFSTGQRLAAVDVSFMGSP